MLAGRCLEFENSDGVTVTPGVYHYSNTDPTFWTVMMEHVTGVRFSGRIGDAASHEGSLLQQFFEQEVGLDSFGDAGVFRQPGTIDPGEPTVMPTPRHWNAAQNTLRPYSDDEKRPHCRFENGVCSFEQWVDGDRANWNWALEQVPFDRAGVGVGAATGGLSIRPRFMLEFMNKFRVGGYDPNPTIGEPRTAWNAECEPHRRDVGRSCRRTQLQRQLQRQLQGAADRSRRPHHRRPRPLRRRQLRCLRPASTCSSRSTSRPIRSARRARR